MIVYKVTNLINGKIYVGQDSHNNPNYYGSGNLIQLAIKKYGKKNFKKEILEYCSSKEELDKKETFWINELNSSNKAIGYNIKEYASGRHTFITSEELKNKLSNANKNYIKSLTDEERKAKYDYSSDKIVSDETRQKLSISAKNRKPMSEETKAKIAAASKMRKHSEETKQKMALSRTGQKRSEESKLKMSLAQIGTKKSEETKLKISQANKGNKMSEETKKKMSEAAIKRHKLKHIQ